VSYLHGVVPAKVVKVDDPDGMGRVLVSLKWLPGKNESFWAPVATLMSGGGRGSWFMPEKDDEVLVAFEHGEVDSPYIVGYLWNGKQKPPDSGGTKVRRLHTVAGHLLEFHDESGKEKILLKTAGKQRVELDDTAKTVTIEAAGHEKVTLEPGKVTVETQGKQSVTLADAPASIAVHSGMGDIKIEAQGITISHPAGQLNVTCLQATVNASAQATITAPMLTFNAPFTTFSGVVSAPMITTAALSAAAVASPVYTPGVGNLMGL
jgi:uncharacterized protein involved in type VI secretion and phage assembly